MWQRLEKEGRIHARGYEQETIIEEMEFTYPLKIISPRLANSNSIAIAYMLNYGGGLVGGDALKLSILLSDAAKLAILTQGTTKVFKSKIDHSTKPTLQHLTFTLGPRCSLFLLPDPVTCYESANYEQFQVFNVHSDSNVIILDWFTSGRMSRGERWQFLHYKSINEFHQGGKCIARDVLLLDNTDMSASSLSSRLDPYSCFASLFCFGTSAVQITEHLANLASSMKQLQLRQVPHLIWSISSLSDRMVVVRIAGMETEQVRDWIRNHTHGLNMQLGDEVFNHCFI